MSYKLEQIVAWAKRRGFVYPGSYIYGGLANAWDLWPYWVLLRKNILDSWWKDFVQKRNDIVWIDSQILMNPKVWKVSWHLDGFADPLIDCKKCKNRYRADKLVEDYMEENLDEEFPNNRAWEATPSKDFLDYFGKKNIVCPNCWALERSDVKSFNLMFKTKQWVVEDASSDIYLRPETAQGIFVNFKNILDTMRVRVPFWMAQIGKSFRNEITPGNFLFRLREFEQMEIEYFVEPWKDLECLEDWKKESFDWWENVVWISKDNMRFREHWEDELSHYSSKTYDIEYKFPWGWWELQWIADRTDFDLKQHMKYSGVDLQYSDPKTGKRYVPYVIEPSWWLTRALVTVMIDAYDEEKYVSKNWKDESRTVLRFHKNMAPVKFAVLPLLEKNKDMVEKSKQIFDYFNDKYYCEIDLKWGIWKRYRRQDEIWTPYCITVDHQTLQDWTVTIRYRDSMEQERKKVEDIEF